MSLSSRSYVNRYTPSNRFPAGVKWLLIVNTVIFLLYKLAPPLEPVLIQLAMVPYLVVHGRVWQLFTYMFLHVGVMDAVWNLLTIWLFGAALERTWGTTKFLRYYFTCGVAAGVAAVILCYAFGGQHPLEWVVSSAGAGYGILLAYAVLFPDNTLLFGFVFPMKSKLFVTIVAVIGFLQTFPWSIGRMSLLAGIPAGYLVLRGKRLQGRVNGQLLSGYKEWKRRRAHKKFEVYLKRRGSGPDRTIH